MTLLVLRPEPGAAATARRAARLGLDAVTAPLFAVVPIAWEVPQDRFEAVMLTSANAVRHGGEGLLRFRSLPAYCVGASTARAAQAAGFEQVRIGDGDAAALVERIAADDVQRVLHLAGRDHRAVAHPGVTIERRIVYAAEPTTPQPAFARAIAAGAIALVHSPRAGARLAELVAPEARRRVAVAAISPSALAAAGEGWAGAQAAREPHDDALLALAASMCD